MATVHISESEATSDFAGVMSHIREGSEVVIEANNRPVAVLRPTEPFSMSISATIARLDKLAEERGHELIMDADFAADVEERVKSRKPRDRSAYED
jgi:antitoxin (DNA-binding transcriptional repressor) of toxin-antitoxin stability system